MTNKFKYGEVVLINGKGKFSGNSIINKLGIVKEKEYYYNDYYVEVFLGQDDWFNEKDLKRAIEKVNGKTKKYDIMIATTDIGAHSIYKKIKNISKENKWHQLKPIKKYEKDGVKYCVLMWKNVYWPETNESVIQINRAIDSFKQQNIPYQYIIVGKNIDAYYKKEFIENDPNVDVLEISVKIKNLRRKK